MKTGIIAIIFLFFSSTTVVQAQEVSVSIGYQSFYDDLSPYGTWINYPGYGYVWQYRYAHSFKPYYTRGHWVYTDYGWTWASDYNWGWATFHYGRWFYDDYLGWLWMPGNEWAPAWVTWGQYNDGFCWAPVGPGVDLSVGAGYRPPANYWVACPGAYFGRSDWNTHVVNITHNTTVVNNITIIRNNNNSVRYSRGPQAESVERFTKTPVRAMPVAEHAGPGVTRVDNNRLAIYRPAIHETTSTARPAPRHVEEANKLRPADKPVVRNGTPATTTGTHPATIHPAGPPVNPNANRPAGRSNVDPHAKNDVPVNPPRHPSVPPSNHTTPNHMPPAPPPNHPAPPRQSMPSQHQQPHTPPVQPRTMPSMPQQHLPPPPHPVPPPHNNPPPPANPRHQ